MQKIVIIGEQRRMNYSQSTYKCGPRIKLGVFFIGYGLAIIFHRPCPTDKLCGMRLLSLKTFFKVDERSSDSYISQDDFIFRFFF